VCGILGIAAVRGSTPSVNEAGVAHLRDMMARRGPDAAGSWRHENVALAHRRLSVIDPGGPMAAQPMLLSETGRLIEPGDRDTPVRFALVYNGEIYNDADVRREVARRGAQFRTSCDTETVLHAWAMWGTEALSRLRGMFALGVYDAKLDLLTLARDALGVKPLYFWLGPREIMFASEVRPILSHPGVVSAPDARMVSAYLTTIRTVLGNQTLFQGVYALRPGQMLQCDLSSRGESEPAVRLLDWWRGPRVLDADPDPALATARVREAVSDSVRRHLVSDVPLCALLSGGLDSTIITAIARRERASLRTFAAGCPVGEGAGEGDLVFARRAASALETAHAEALVTRELFAERWGWMVQQMGTPLSTPNEVAIYEVARLLRERGCVVTLSGEGADELFGGYEAPMEQAAAYVAARELGGPSPHSPGAFQLRASAWVPPDFKHGVLSDRAWQAAEEDRWLEQLYDDEFAWAAGECGTDGLSAHLRLHRRVNLTGLLQRLDTATMLAGVEGRTPFADAQVATAAEMLPMWLKYEGASAPGHGGGATSGTGASAPGVGTSTWRRTASRTKIVLREAFARDVPAAVLERPKASFPLPFQQWMCDATGALEGSALADEFFSPAAIKAVRENPGQLWHLAWPMINLSMWGRAMGW
jgi:asparagine synthase (glutamine-hydrolysing)